VELDFKSDVSSSLPFEVGLSLFRLLQEALHKAVKHSGVKQAQVQVTEQLNKVHLTVRDSGSGFDFEAAKRGGGLGLHSMLERVRLVHGEIDVDSKPMRGTTIHVCVPFKPGRAAQRAVG
jgi:signal transduction histidine kinase